jgi:signal transduction histidine kinase
MAFFRPLFQARTYRETLYLLLDLVVAVFWLTVLWTLVSTGLGLLITLVGLPILTGAFLLARYGARLERWRGRTLLHATVEDPPARPPRDGWLWKLVDPFTDAMNWREIAYLGLVQPIVGIVTFSLAVTAWATALGLLAGPISWIWAEPDLGWSWADRNAGWIGAVSVAVGVVALFAAPWIIRGLAAVDRGILGLIDARGTLQRRVVNLEETRARTVDVAIADRRQIERDLHDGAQQRLLALGMELSRAIEKFDDDPEEAKRLVTEAHGEVQAAIVELRSLARGIHPAVLTDRGLDAALSSLAARSPVPVRLDVDLTERPSASVEATAYFVVAEALANAAKHAEATEIRIRVETRDDRLYVVVSDDGDGGAEVRPAGGLEGLRDRVAAVDGTLAVTSPPGGPTLLVAELPCGS